MRLLTRQSCAWAERRSRHDILAQDTSGRRAFRFRERRCTTRGVSGPGHTGSPVDRARTPGDKTRTCDRVPVFQRCDEPSKRVARMSAARLHRTSSCSFQTKVRLTANNRDQGPPPLFPLDNSPPCDRDIAISPCLNGYSSRIGENRF